jgi:ribosome-binding factor A
MSHRAEQLTSVIHRAVQSAINDGLADPRLQVMVTVTSVDLAEDRRTASVNVSIMPEKSEKLAMHGLRDAAKHIRRSAAEKTKIHRMPLLNFKVDKGLKKQTEMLLTLAELNAERQEKLDNQLDAQTDAAENDL